MLPHNGQRHDFFEDTSEGEEYQLDLKSGDPQFEALLSFAHEEKLNRSILSPFYGNVTLTHAVSLGNFRREVSYYTDGGIVRLNNFFGRISINHNASRAVVLSSGCSTRYSGEVLNLLVF